MALVDISLLAPEQRHDHAAAVGKPIIDARHVGVKFKVEHGTVDALLLEEPKQQPCGFIHGFPASKHWRVAEPRQIDPNHPPV